jgi:hypothetical protein
MHQGGEVLVSRTAGANSSDPSITHLKDGGFVVSWYGFNPGNSTYSIHGQRYQADGRALGSEFMVNTTVAGARVNPSITALNDGGFIVIWNGEGYNQGGGYDIYGQRYLADGTRQGSEFLINTTATGAQSDPKITTLHGGGFVVAWVTTNPLDLTTGVSAQIYRADGSKLGTEFAVNNSQEQWDHTFFDEFNPTLTALSDGGFALTWVAYNPFFDASAAFAQRFHADGTIAFGDVQLTQGVGLHNLSTSEAKPQTDEP